ncbi:FHA domain-containing protein [bacterium]|nr:FHA domain-containing protein [bacterium]
MDENNQNNAKPTIDKEYLKKLAEKIKAEKARKEALGKKADTEPTPPSISSISSKYLSDDDEEEIASEKTAIIDLSALSGHAADAKLTIVDGKDSGKNIEITKDEILAGRSLDNDFVISDISVSRKHFKIKKEGDRFVISDMGSGNGIKVNGSKTTSATLSDGDIISVGARQIKFEILNPDLKPKQQRTTKQTMPTNYDQEEEEPVKKGSSPLVLVAIIVVILIGIGGVAYFMLFDNQNSKPKTAVSASFGENDKAAIEKLIAAKDLKNAEKAVLAANDRTSGDNPYKSWLNEQLVIIGKEKTNQTTFENAKSVIQKNPEEADKLLKSIPASSIFYKDAQNLLLTIPAKSTPKKDEVKAEPKKEEPKAEPKKEEPKKDEVKAEPKKAEPKKEAPKAEPKKETVKSEPKAEPKEEPKKEEVKAEPKKEAPKKAEAKKAEPKPAPEKKAKKATMSEEEAKTVYMEANAMKDENPEEAKKMLQKIINSVDPSSKRYKKAKELLEKL